MFQDLDDTLRVMLDDSAAPEQVRAAEVSFDPPDRDFRPSQATVNLFLHDVRENRALRDDTPIVQQTDHGYLSTRPPMRVDCTYLVTTWSSGTGGQKVREEHALLGSVLRWFSRFPVLEERFLQGDLRHPPQLYPLAAAVSPPNVDQGMGHFWSALGVAPRPTFALTVTIGLQLTSEADRYPVVEAIRLKSRLRGDAPRLSRTER